MNGWTKCGEDAFDVALTTQCRTITCASVIKFRYLSSSDGFYFPCCVGVCVCMCLCFSLCSVSSCWLLIPRMPHTNPQHIAICSLKIIHTQQQQHHHCLFAWEWKNFVFTHLNIREYDNRVQIHLHTHSFHISQSLIWICQEILAPRLHHLHHFFLSGHSSFVVRFFIWLLSTIRLSL